MSAVFPSKLWSHVGFTTSCTALCLTSLCREISAPLLCLTKVLNLPNLVHLSQNESEERKTRKKTKEQNGELVIRLRADICPSTNGVLLRSPSLYGGEVWKGRDRKGGGSSSSALMSLGSS
jgi:hypothetical protein